MTELQKAREQNLHQGAEGAIQQAEPRTEERALIPPVEIYEEADAVFVVADMPGVTGENLDVEVGNGVLEIEGRIAVAIPEDASASFAEVRASRYARRFNLGNEIDASAAEASIRDGVVTVRLPKQDSHRRRRVEIKAA